MQKPKTDKDEKDEKEEDKEEKKDKHDHEAADQFSQSLLELALPVLSQLAYPQSQSASQDFDLYAPEEQEQDKKKTEEKHQDAQKAYQAIFTEQQKIHDLWWKKEFQHAASKIVQGIQRTLAESGAPAAPYFPSLSYKITYAGITKTFDPHVHPSVLIGTKRGCDILLDGTKQGLSRLHAAVYFIPTHNSVVLLDVGSTNGLTRLFDSDMTVEQTKATVFLLKWKEKARFRLRGDESGVELILGC